MKYKVGDKVRIKSLDWYKQNRNPRGGYRVIVKEYYYAFVKNMSEFCGQVFTIKQAFEETDENGRGFYYLKEPSLEYCWQDYMFEEEKSKQLEFNF